MQLLRTIKSDYEFFHHQPLNILVAIDGENKDLLLKFWRNNTGKKSTNTAHAKISGYKLILDQEFQSLKIDFSEMFQFDARDLMQTK
jgi:hypothetical protein